MRILLTGGSGMLGRAISELLAADYPRYKLFMPSHSELDLKSADAVRDFFRGTLPDVVIHCAARVGGIQANISNPVAFLYENSLMSLNLVDAAAKAGVTRLLYLGSSCMYPRDYTMPLREDYLLAAPLEPTNEGYALAKILGAKLCEYYNRQFGTSFKTLMACNLYGPYDHFDLLSGHLVAALLMKLDDAKKAGKETVTIWGDGSARREFLYAGDLAEFICASIERIPSFPDYLNVGYGQDFSVLDYYKMGAEVVGYSGMLETDPSKPAGMKQKLLDSSRASAFGWCPRTHPRDGMNLAYRYYLQKQKECLAK